MHTKDEVLNSFMTHKTEIEIQCDLKIKILRSDKGGEYIFLHFVNLHELYMSIYSLYSTTKWSERT